MDLIKYAAELLDSESNPRRTTCMVQGYSAPLLSRGGDVSSVLFASTHRIQKLIYSLMISSSSLDEAAIGSIDYKKEIGELAATIVADVAAHIDDLSKYPSAMRCISSLLQHQEETTHKYRNGNSKQLPDDLASDVGRRNLTRGQKRMKIREHRHQNKREGGTSNKLVQQGLTILERLASNNDDNCRIICSAPGLLPKITAPIYSETLIQDIKTMAWADIVTRCLKVLYQLIRAPNSSHEIFSKGQALSNLKKIIELGNNEADLEELQLVLFQKELQLVAMEILTKLALDPINLDEDTKKVLVTKQLDLFLLVNEDDEKSAAIAGRAMVSLSTNRESNFAHIIMTAGNGIMDYLNSIFDDENITRRTIAAEIVANLCAHCNCNVDNMKLLLTEVLKAMMSQERNESVSHNNAEIEEISDQERDEQEAFFSLAQVICDKLKSVDLDDTIQKAVDPNNVASEEQRREAFVEQLKTIIDDNCHPTADSLRIVKLCGQIARSVMRCKQYVEIFRNKGFKSSLSAASKTMSELESCMHFVGSDFGPKKTVRPLLSEIEESFGQI